MKIMAEKINNEMKNMKMKNEENVNNNNKMTMKWRKQCNDQWNK